MSIADMTDTIDFFRTPSTSISGNSLVRDRNYSPKSNPGEASPPVLNAAVSLLGRATRIGWKMD
jgi:hypothetical protein